MTWTTRGALVLVFAVLVTVITLIGFPVVDCRRSVNPHHKDVGVNITKILNAFFEHGYDKRVRPNYGGPPVEVLVSMYIVSISSVSEVLMDFTSDFYFRQTWQDPRLAFEARPGIEELSVGADVAERIWVPDTFFANEKSAYFHEATTPNTFLRVKHRGEVLRSMRLTVTASCPMELQYFPMDRQKCSIEVESYGYSMADIRYKWMNSKAVGVDGEVMLPQFNILGHRQSAKEVSLSTGNYSRLICEIQLVRSMGYYMIQIYIPASLIVIISWVSFWLHRNATPARVQLGVLTVLTMTTLMSSTNSQLPKISYVKSIDVFLGTCFVMVFAALLEYAAVGYIGKRISMRKNRFHQLAKAADEKRRRLLQVEAATGMKYRACDDMDTPPLPPLPPPPPQLVSHYATIRRDQPRTCTNTSSNLNMNNQQPSTRSLTQILANQAGRPQEVRLDMVGTKTTVSVAQSPPGLGGDFDGLSPSGMAPRSPYNGNHTPHSRSGSLRHRNPARDGSGARHSLATLPPPPLTMAGKSSTPRNLNELFGVSPSDIDKYSRVVFPVCFVCFNLMYWMIYLHISNVLNDDMLESKA